MGLKGPMRGPNGLYGAHRNETPKTFSFLLGDHLNLDRKTVSISVKTFFLFWRSLENPDKSVPFSLPVLDCTNPEMRNI